MQHQLNREMVGSGLSEYSADLANKPEMQKIRYQVLAGFVICVIILLLYALIRVLIRTLMSFSGGRGRIKIEPYTRLATSSASYTTDPADENSKKIKRSMNERNGIEFTYALWMWVDKETWEMNTVDDRHVLHKGNDNAYPNRAPGIFISKNRNELLVYMNTFDENSIFDIMSVDNIPVGKWFHVTVIITQPKNLDVYINGFLRKRKILDGIPKQNYGNVYITQNGGFVGYLSKIYYYDYAITAVQTQKLVSEGPSKKMSTSVSGEPPYLAPSWWLDSPNAVGGLGSSKTPETPAP